MTVIALTMFSVSSGCAGAVLAAQAGLGLPLTFASYLVCATLGSAFSVLLMMHYNQPNYEH